MIQKTFEVVPEEVLREARVLVAAAAASGSGANDDWQSIGDWDLNIYADDSGAITGILYPVVNEKTDTKIGYNLDGFPVNGNGGLFFRGVVEGGEYDTYREETVFVGDDLNKCKSLVEEAHYPYYPYKSKYVEVWNEGKIIYFFVLNKGKKTHPGDGQARNWTREKYIY